MIEIRTKKLASFKERSVGLIGAAEPHAVFFKTRFGIHTFFMNFPIDVLILNQTNKAVCIKKNLKPNRIFFWNPLLENVLELPENTIINLKIKKGDTIKLTFYPRAY